MVLPELDTHLAIGAVGDGTVTHVEGGSTYRYAAMSDGSWRGLGSVSSIRLQAGYSGELRLEEIVGDEPPEVYVRAGEPPYRGTASWHLLQRGTARPRHARRR